MARNREIARAVINGASARDLVEQFKISAPAIRDAVQTCLKHDAPDFHGWGFTELRENAHDILPLLTGERASAIARANGAELAGAVADPWGNLGKAAKLCGLNPAMTKKLVERLRGLEPAIQRAKEIKNEDLVKLLNERAYLLLAAMDETTIAKAGLGDLARAAGIVIDKRQLLRGEPTQIMSHKDRTRLDELIMEVVKVAEKRGIVDLKTGEWTDKTGEQCAKLPCLGNGPVAG